MDELLIGFMRWLGRGVIELLIYVFDLNFVPKLIRFPGTVIIECTVGSNRYHDDPATVAEYVVGLIFWLGVLFGIYMLMR